MKIDKVREIKAIPKIGDSLKVLCRGQKPFLASHPLLEYFSI